MRLPVQLAMPLLAGMLHAAGVAWPLHFLLDYGQPQWPLQLLSLALLAGALLGASSAGQAALRAWVFTTVYLGCTFGWLFTAMHTYGGMPAPLAALAEWLLAGALALYFAFAGALWWRLAQRGAFSGALLFGLVWMMAELARLRGQDWYASRNHAIDRLARRVIEGSRDPAWFNQHTGVAQLPLQASGWVEFYRLRSPDGGVFDAAHARGPFHSPRLGGDLTLMATHGIVRTPLR
jgi:hypothetical protein